MTLDDDTDYVRSPAMQKQQRPFAPTAASFFSPSRDDQFEAAALISASATTSTASAYDGAASAQNWITVFGYPPGCEDAVRAYFRAVSEVVDVKYTPYGRMHLWYVCA